MSRPITLFSGYSQRENRTTNYCLLVLRMLYEENPKFLAEVLSSLVGEELGEQIGVKFRQQEKKSASVPDGLIIQPAFTVYIETKGSNWFYDEQLANHLEALDKETSGLKVLIALSVFDVENGDQFQKIRGLCDGKYKGTIVFEQVSFDDFVEALNIPQIPKNLTDAVSDFRAYLDEQSLLASWTSRLDVVNCAGLPDDVLSENVYACPATGGAYNHARCKYFGMYRDKRVDKIAMIEAVVDLEDAEKASLKWRNISGSEESFIKTARAKLDRLIQQRPRSYPVRVFLLGSLHDTDFRKDTPGGMFNSKRYFDIDELKPADAERLASALNGKAWSQLPSPWS